MNPVIKWNLLCGWCWILLAFASGLGMGLRFHDDQWAGGYSSWQRRLLRLAHISYFGLGTINILFYLTVRSTTAAVPSFTWASGTLLAGAVSMPACCYLAAFQKRWVSLFAVPVLSLLAAGVITVWNILFL